MVLDNYRSTGTRLLTPLAKLMPIGPNGLSLLSFILAVGAGAVLAFQPDLGMDHTPLLIFALLVTLSAGADALDGLVARLRGLESKQGDLLDHTLDRLADIFLLGGLALSPYCDLTVGFVGLLAVLMVSYMGTQAQALGAGRNYGGLLGRADRLAILMLLPIIQWVLIELDAYAAPGGRYWLEWMMLAFLAVGMVTICQRFLATWRALGKTKDKKKKK